MDTKKMDRTMEAMGALLILISSYQLFFNSTHHDNGPELATLTSTRSVVKTKSASALDWRDAGIGSSLSENQLVYTDSDSRADLEFKNGNVLSIGESSLVKIKTSADKETLDLARGLVHFKLESGKPLSIQLNGRDYTLVGDQADVQINLGQKKGEIGVLSGEVKVASEGMTEKLDSKVAMSIDDKSVSKKPILFKATVPEMKYAESMPAAVPFQWTPVEVATINLSQDSSFTKVQKFSGGSGLTIPLGPGLYYYKIENEHGTSLMGSVRVAQEFPPTLLRPLDGEKVEIIVDAVAQVQLQWKNPENLKHRLEWVGGNLGARELFGSSTKVDVTTKDFKWRLKIEDPLRPEALWSPWQHLELSLVEVPGVPLELAPHEVEYQVYETPLERVELSWSSKHPVELERTGPEGSFEVLTIEGKTYDWAVSAGGEYQWRVRGVDATGRFGGWSEWQKFKLIDLSHEKNAEGVQTIELKKPDQEISFSWETQHAESSVFELSRDTKFRDIVKKIEVSTGETKVSVPKTGLYYWRARHYLKDGSFEVSEPKRVIIRPVAAPIKPHKFPDMEVPIRPKTTWLKTIFNFLIPSAEAADKGLVKLELPIKEDAKMFILRIYRDKTLRELVHEVRLNTKSFEWNTTPGTYYWQYAIVDYWDRESPFSDPSALVVTAGAIERPRLLSPIRAQSVSAEFELKWTASPGAMSYHVDVAEDAEFKAIIASETSQETHLTFKNLPLKNALHYWRVIAVGKKSSTPSHTGRFVMAAPVMPGEHQKQWKNRIQVAWSPSKDTYTFTDGKKGTIDGTAMMSASAGIVAFSEKYVYGADLLIQRGEVFEGQPYLFQRIELHLERAFAVNLNHKLALGLTLGQSSGAVYEISGDDEVKASSVSGLSYGPSVRDYYSLNAAWDLEARASYLLGSIKQMEFGMNLLKHSANFYWLGGVSLGQREYEISSGKQSSLRLNLGVGREF